MSDVVLVAIGDVMLGGRVNDTLDNKGEEFVFGGVSRFLRQGDILFLNLEMPFSEGLKPFLPHAHESFMVPLKRIKTINYMGAGVVNIGTNHILDFGEEGIKMTMDVLKENNIFTIGGGMDEAESRKPAVLDVNGLKVCFMGYCKRGEYSAEGPKAGASPLEISKIEEDVRSIRERVDFLILSLHWGIELSPYPSPEQVKISHRLIESGVDVIIGHHPHVLQGIERYRGGIVFYSLGNFIFDNTAGKVFYRGMLKERSESVIAIINLKKDSPAEYKLIPVFFDNSLRVLPATDERGKEIINRIDRVSRVLQENKLNTVFFGDGVEGIIKRELITYRERLKKEKLKFVVWAIKNFKWRYITTLLRYILSRFGGLLKLRRKGG